MRGLEGRTAIVTGGGSGIGRAIVLRLLQEGCKVAIFDLDPQSAAETIQLAGKNSANAKSIQVDITNHAEVGSAVASVEADIGEIDVLVNNAGWDKASPFLQTDPAFWQKVVAINYIGVMTMHHQVLPLMVKRSRGKVVNIASDAGRVGSSGEAVYAGCKGAVIAFGKTIARELARSNVMVNTICPGPTDTPGFRAFAGGGDVAAKIVDGLSRAIPLRRLGTPEDYGGMVAFLASDDANFITGQVISVSGGLTMHG